MVNLFLTEEDLSPWELKLSEENPSNNLKIWTNLKQGVLVQRIVEILWNFDSPEKALGFHMDNLGVNSEKSPEISAKSLEPFGQDLRVYLKDGADPLLMTIGMYMKIYYFLFCEGCISAKVFVSGTPNLFLDEAAEYARLAHHRIAQ